MSTSTQHRATGRVRAARPGAPEPTGPGIAVRVARGLGAALALLLLVVGIPVGLWFFGGPIVTGEITWDSVLTTLSTPDVTGSVLLGLVKVVGWLAWATFAVAVLIEVVAAARGVRSPRLHGLGLQQRAAAALVGAVVTMLVSAPGAGPAFAATAAGPTADLASPTSGVSVSAEATQSGGTTTEAAAAIPTTAETPAPPATYTVKAGDSLWRIAAQTLGDGARFKEIANLNYGVAQPGGGTLDASHWIEPGWVLTLPSDAAEVVSSSVVTAGTVEGEPDELTTSAGGTHTVVPGDTLWEIAEDELGDGTKYPELYEASKDTVQPGGAHLSDPDLILPGWNITVPGATPTAAQTSAPAPEAPAPAQPGESTGESGSAQGEGTVEGGTDAAGEASDAAAAPEAVAEPTAPAAEQPAPEPNPAPAAEAPVGDAVTSEDLSTPEIAESAPAAEQPVPERPAEQAAPAQPAPEAESTAPATPFPEGASIGAPEDESLPVPNPAAAPADTPIASQFQAVTPDDLVADPTLEQTPEQGSTGIDPFDDGVLAPELTAPAPEQATSPTSAPVEAEGAPEAQAETAAPETTEAGGAAEDTAASPDTTVPDAAADTAAPEAGAPQAGATLLPEVTTAPPSGSVGDEVRPEDLAADGATEMTAAPEATAAPEPVAEATDPEVAAALADADLAEELDESLDVRTVTGVGGLLAAGILALIAAKRANARRRRKAGERIAIPAPSSPPGVLEQQLRAVEDTFGREQVDLALRSLANWHRERALPLPGVRVARLKSGDFVELYLDRPAQLPHPWASTTDRYVWQLSAADLDGVLDDARGDAPYPSLVTIGHDDEDAHLMLDLENVACLDIRGTDESAQATLAALAIELATSLWADDLQVTVVGALGDLPGAVDTGRVRHVPSLAGIVRELEARAADVERTLGQVGASSVADARGRGLAMDAWTPEILLVGERLGTAERTALEALVDRVPGVGIAAVTSSADLGEWVLDLTGELTGGDTSRGVLVPAYIAVRPQQLDAETYSRALDLLGDPEQVPGPEWARNLPPAPEPAVEEIRPQVVPVGAAARRAFGGGVGVVERPSLPGGPTADGEPGAAAPVEPLAVPRAGNPWVEPTAPKPARTPVVRVLGPVELAGMTGTPLPASHQRQALELVSFLAFNPGARGADISKALWPSREPNLATRRSAVSRARRWLGVDAYGYEYLPRYWSSDDGSQVDQESAGYRLRGVTTDWDQFCELVGPDVTSAPLEDLRSALTLVRGRPFEDAPARKYVWAETLLQEITAGVVDVAHEVARRALVVGDIALAREASKVGRTVDPVDERSWRNGIKAEWADRKPDAVVRLVDRLRDHLEQLELEPEPETEDLISKVHVLAGKRTRER
ncbi:LysM peptidoglycan-binding domain-containing protein [Antribacter sp. KLBMP9083]|uniref:LysM peptidoglycan-binding domain-containing protein n=1 Tax=Antribacter soli TaxID=2910976 RepID=A0AA41U6K8_9MICO|nr:LysM peptidoglycan-binding domain-containing protein [Antribacter soli]MCF4120405.1 LysM peptidoglycan-binding domain-containing protein [Antribacter soli]